LILAIFLTIRYQTTLQVVRLVEKNGNGKTGNHRMEKLQRGFHRIQENIKIEYGCNAIASEVKNVIDEVGSMQEKSEYGLSLEQEKALFIDAANQFLYTIERTKINPI
jgi:hypothetical protein